MPSLPPAPSETSCSGNYTEVYFHANVKGLQSDLALHCYYISALYFNFDKAKGNYFQVYFTGQHSCSIKIYLYYIFSIISPNLSKTFKSFFLQSSWSYSVSTVADAIQ